MNKSTTIYIESVSNGYLIHVEFADGRQEDTKVFESVNSLRGYISTLLNNDYPIQTLPSMTIGGPVPMPTFSGTNGLVR